MGLMQSFFTFQNYFSPHKNNLQKIAHLKETLQREKLKVSQLENQVVDFQQEIAVQLPALEKLKGGPLQFQMRNLASITQKPLSVFDMSGVLNERARSQFRDQDYKAAIQSFRELTQKFPTSPLVVEGYFFWAESLFLNKQAQECLDVIEVMMTQFPQHELTGFIMLRMGQILQSRNRAEEAKEVFKAVAKAFAANHELQVQAGSLAQAVE